MAILAYFFVIASLLLCPQICIHSTREALSTWSLHVVPSLFPYMVFSKLLSEQIKHTACPPALVCSVLGIFGGSPSGASMINVYGSRLSPKSSLALAAFTGTISPMFFLGTIRSWINDPLLCIHLLICQCFSAFMTAGAVLLTSRPSRPIEIADASPHSDKKTPLAQSIDAILQVGGTIICFSVIASLLSQLPLPKALYPILHAILEISGGVYAIMRFAFPERIQAVLLAFVSGFSGLCILFQNLMFLRPLGISLQKLLFVSFVRGLFSAAVMTLLLFI